VTGKTDQTAADPVELEVPRDRNGTFDPGTIPKGVGRLTDFDDMIMPLSGRGMTIRDIAEHLQVTYGASVSHETIANITDSVNEVEEERRARPLYEAARSCV
jgi:putative transposase